MIFSTLAEFLSSVSYFQCLLVQVGEVVIKNVKNRSLLSSSLTVFFFNFFGKMPYQPSRLQLFEIMPALLAY